MSESNGLLAEATGGAEAAKLPGHYCTVILAGDPTTYTVRVTNREYVAWDMTAPKHKWGTAQQAPFLSATFMAYAAGKREGLWSMSFDAFRERAEDVSSINEDEDGEDIGARPTTPAPPLGNS
jgi:hypothetical protein